MPLAFSRPTRAALYSLPILSLLMSPASPQGFDLTGLWQDAAGVTYQLRQVEDRLYWRADNLPEFLSVYHGRIAGDTIFGQWTDLPGGQRQRHGELTLRVSSPDELRAEGMVDLGTAFVLTRKEGAPPSPPSPPVTPGGPPGGTVAPPPSVSPGGASPGGPAPHGGPPLPTIASGQGVVSATDGGTIATSDGSVSLSVPPGAVADDTSISFTCYTHAPHPENPILGEIVFTPGGLQFREPATLTVTLPPADASDRSLTVVSDSPLNEEISFGGERSRVSYVTDFTFDAATRRLSIPVRHFSYYSWLWEKTVYLVFDFRDGSVLKPADLLYALTGRKLHAGAHWFPGHTALYFGDSTSAGGEGGDDAVIESTPIAPMYGYNYDGVQIGTFANLKSYTGQHIFMGARRPLFDVTDDERGQILSYALGLHRANTPFWTTGGPFEFQRDWSHGISCVGLTEAAYQAGTGKKIVPELLRPLLYPIRQFCYTLPVNEIEIEPDEHFDMFLKGVTKPGPGSLIEAALNLLPRTGRFFDDDKYFKGFMKPLVDSPAAEACAAGRAKFREEMNLFSFTPNGDDAGYTHEFIFTVDAAKSGLGKVTKSLFIKVKEKPEELTLPPALSAKGVVRYPEADRHPSMKLDEPAKSGKYELSLVIVDLKPGGQIQGKSVVTAEDPIKVTAMRDGGGFFYPVVGTRKSTYEYRWKGTLKGTEPNRQRFYADDLIYQVHQVVKITPAEGRKRESIRERDRDVVVKPWGEDGKKRNWRFQLSGNLLEKPDKQLLIGGTSSAPTPINWQRDPLIVGAE